jgi:hypothetical protein
MSSFRIRPRFRQIRSEKPEYIEKVINEKLKNHKTEFSVTALPGHLILKIHPSNRHFWSPQLQLSFEEHGEGTIIRGLYGPNPTVWAVFFFSYASLGLIAIIVGMWVLSQYMLKMETTLWWILPVCAALAAILYFIAQTGQKIGASQMFDLHHFYENSFNEKVPIN